MVVRGALWLYQSTTTSKTRQTRQRDRQATSTPRLPTGIGNVHHHPHYISVRLIEHQIYWRALSKHGAEY